MTHEEAIKKIDALKFACRQKDFYDIDFEFALALAIEALEKQIPHKPVGRHTDYRCSVCGTRVRSGQGSSSRTKDTVCRNCYTVIDWSDEK